MKVLRTIGMVLFIIGAVIAILDLLDVLNLDNIDNPFYGALALMIAGMSLTFLSQRKEEAS